MLSRVRTAALWGLEAFPVECEVDVGPGLPGFVLVGLPDASGREARDRVWPALRNAGFQLPDRKVTVNLAPAERRKEGASADLAMALGVLAATGQAPAGRLEGAAALGEIALDGRLRGIRGTLPLAEALWRTGVTSLLCAAACAPEAALVEGLTVHAVGSVHEVVGWLRGEELPRSAGTEGLHRVGIDRGLFLGTPAGTKFRQKWLSDPAAMDPGSTVFFDSP